MQHETLKLIAARLNQNLEAGTETWAESDLVHRASTYNDAGHMAAELAVMRRYPVIIAHSVSLPKAGDFITDNSLGVPVLVSRQSNGGLKAFLNICRHRGSPVCLEKSGSTRIFVCPYHAWSYRSDGSLLKAPSEQGKDAALVELPVEERHGLIWLVATSGAKIDVAAHLGPLDEEFQGFRLGEFVQERGEVLTEGMNWKYVLDGFLEVYHIPKLHAASIGRYIHGKFSLFDQFGLHGRLVVVRKALDEKRRLPLEDRDLLKLIAVNYVIFPNTILVWQGDHFELWAAYPGGDPAHCSIRILSLTTPQTATEEYRARWDKNWKILLDTVQQEDWAISKRVQAGIPYLAEDRIVFGRNEPALQHFHGQLRAAIEVS
jgi:phenylpropionate dioxygenase-like ring-hydroxylating dioxygenase large terminal subunit